MSEDIPRSQQIVIETFRELRIRLMHDYGSAEFSRKSDYSHLTQLDILVERTLRKALAQVYDEQALGFEGEETGAHGNHETYWLVDPIDGTVPFIRGLPFCTNMAALIHNGETRAAVIYDFVADAMYTATKGGGASKNNQPIHVSSRPIEDAMVTIESPRFAEVRTHLKVAGIKSITPVVASGHGFIMTAEGKLEGRLQYRGYGKVHDYAPGALLVAEAGGELVTLAGEVYDTSCRDFAAVTPAVAEYLRNSQHDIITMHEGLKAGGAGVGTV